MKTHTSDYKTAIATPGRMIKNEISYTLNEEDIILNDDNLYSVNYNYQGSILKSVMKQLEINCKEDIPLNTILNGQFSLLVNDEWEDINFGNYVVYKSERQKDTETYKITCYDKMLYSMKDYESMGIAYPISIRDYINAICQHLGLTFKNINDTFANYNKQIQNELYLDAQGNTLGYTFRDVLDELAQVTASTICINENDDSLEIRYINNTGDTINGDYLKNINVNFGEKYGPVNSIVLSRSAGADNVYLRDEESVAQNGLCEIKITDNQIMNFNDRSDYLPDILYTLDGLQYYLNDLVSTGVTYYNLCDKYNVEIDENTYSCIMFNDEVNITQGLEEKIYTEIPETAETDYTKADKTDRRINQTYLIVDKQNQVIESVVSTVDSQNTKISQITQTVDEINAKISDITDITVSAEDTDAQVELDNVNESEPIQIKIHPIGENISYDYPHNDYPQNDYSKTRTVRFTRTYIEEGVTKTQIIPYELPYDLLYYNQDTYDEFYLDYDSQTCQVTKRCVYNSDGTVGLLSTPQVIDIDPYPTINLGTGNYTVCVLSYNNAYIMVRLMASNIYTTQFATRVEMNSAINQTAEEINLEVSRKVGNDEVISRINQSAEAITINADKINIAGTISAINNNTTTTIIGDKIASGIIKSNNYSAGASGTSIDLTNGVIDTKNFKVNSTGNITATGGSIGGWDIQNDFLGTPLGQPTNTYFLSQNGKSAYMDNAGTRYWFLYFKNKFGVDTDGIVFANDVKLYGATVNGTINSTSGSFGGWNISTNGLTNSNSSIGSNGELSLYPTTGGVYRIAQGAVRFNAQGGIAIASSSNGAVYAGNGNLDLKSCSGHTAYIGCMSDSGGSNERAGISIENGLLAFRSTGYATYNGATVWGSSSKATKENISVLTQQQKDDVYELLKEIPTIQFDYKQQYSGQKNNYGFLIEDIENTKLKTLLHIVQGENDKNIKLYSTEDLARLELIVIQELMKKVERLEELVNG